MAVEEEEEGELFDFRLFGNTHNVIFKFGMRCVWPFEIDQAESHIT